MFDTENTCMCNCNNDFHTNVFLDLNGKPFILGEYLDRRNIQSVDRSEIYSKIDIDSHESMRAVVDIAIDDIGKNNDGTPYIVGNNTKQKRLIEDIIRNYSKLDHQLPMIKKGIGVCINYQLENNQTGYVIRAAQEKLLINDRSYYLDINSKDINDNAIITNFNSTQVSTLTEFTHGRDPMILRITSLQLYYYMVPAIPIKPIPESLVGKPSMFPNPGCSDLYGYLRDNQHHHFIGDPEPVDPVMPPHWSMFNRMYHFDNMGKDIILHFEEINHPRNRVVEIPCGSVAVNRTFYINPGHRIIWRFNIWKNDVIAVSDTTAIGAALKAPYWDPRMNPGCPPPPPNYDTIMRMYNASVAADYEQNAVINQLAATVNDLKSAIEKLSESADKNDDTNKDDTNTIPSTPLTPATPSGDTIPAIPLTPAIPTLPEQPKCNCHHPLPPPPPPFCPNPIHGALIHKINDLENQVDRIGDEMVDEGELTAMTPSDITNIVQDAINSVPDQST